MRWTFDEIAKMSPGGAQTHNPAATLSKLQRNLGIQVTAAWCRTFLATHHGDVVPVEEDLVELGDPPALRRGLVLGDVLENHVDEVVEAEEGPHDLLVVLHYDVNPRADRLVHQLWREREG